MGIFPLFCKPWAEAEDAADRYKTLWEEARSKFEQAEAENAEMLDQLDEMKTLLKQVVAVMDSKDYETQVMTAWVHGHRYMGPMINMKRIREILGLPPKEGDHSE